MDFFKIYLKGISYTFATHNNDVNLGFKAFLRLFNTTLHKYPPINELSKKESKDKLKPCVNKGIKKSVSERQNL